MELRKLWKQYKNIITPLIILVLCIGAGLFGIVPLAQRTMALRGETENLRRDIGMLQTKSSVLKRYDETTLRNDVAVLTSAVPADKSLATLFDTVNALTGQTGVTATDLTLTRPGSIATGSAEKTTSEEQRLGSNIITFSLSVSGSFEAVKAFIAQVGSVRRFLQVRAVDVIFPNPETASARLTLNAFWAPFPATLGTVSQPIDALTDAQEQTIDKTAAIPLVIPGFTPITQIGVSVEKSDPFTP